MRTGQRRVAIVAALVAAVLALAPSIQPVDAGDVEIQWKSSRPAAAEKDVVKRAAYQEAQPIALKAEPAPPKSTVPFPKVPAADTRRRSLPINLPTALQLAGVNPLDVAVATERLRAADAQLQRAKVLWLPTLSTGVNYARHDGRIQDIVGTVFTTSRSSVMLGAGPNAVFAVSDAIYAPLAARQVVRARQADVQTARNDSLLAVAEAYVNVQQARGDLAGAAAAVRRTEELLKNVEELAKDIAPAVEVNRVRAELARRRQAVEFAFERWQIASADLNRLLRLDAAAVVEPVEAPELRVEFLDATTSIDDLIPIALTHRPELASHQALVQATLARLRQEKIRPLVPSVLLRGNATNPGGTLSGGAFGGGVNDQLTNFGARHSYDVQVIWELQNLGLGNRAAIREREAENRQAILEMFRTQDRVAAEVAQAAAQAQRSAQRLRLAEEGLKDAAETAERTVAGSRQTKTVGTTLVLIFRPQEVVAAIQALDQAYRDLYGAVADSNRAQFRLYRALGQPAQCILQPDEAPMLPAPAKLSPPSGKGGR